MKKQTIVLGLTAIMASAILVGCKEEKKSASETGKETTKTTSNALTEAKDAVAKTVETAKETGAKVVEDVKTAGSQAVTTVTEKAKELATPASAKAQELIDSAKSLFNEGKFTDALAKLNQTTNTSPSAEQQSVVDSLKTQVEKAIKATSGAINDATQSATNALNNLLRR